MIILQTYFFIYGIVFINGMLLQNYSIYLKQYGNLSNTFCIIGIRQKYWKKIPLAAIVFHWLFIIWAMLSLLIIYVCNSLVFTHYKNYFIYINVYYSWHYIGINQNLHTMFNESVERWVNKFQNSANSSNVSSVLMKHY